uniref:Telomere-associated protein Rif1 N-terminal domain-containing protein n=1 Tax=Spongospora subterranea TaxID=70186 RepID=A0A0H5QWG2_9EUKA|eukprot:CRZ06097.1 hypothetical protein [Spongospora subterranea]
MNLLGQITDPDSRADLYETVLAELTSGGGSQNRYEPEAIASAIALATSDLRRRRSSLLPLHEYAIRFISFILSGDETVRALDDHTIMSIFKDFVYVLAEGDGKSCALTAVAIAHEFVSCVRPHLLSAASVSLIPALISCLDTRFPDNPSVVQETLQSISHLAVSVPEAMHSLRYLWAPVIFPYVFGNESVSKQVQELAIAALKSVRPSYSDIGKRLYKSKIQILAKRRLGEMQQRAADVKEAESIPAIWEVFIRLLGVYVFADTGFWAKMALIWKTCLRHNQSQISIACLDSWMVVIDAVASHPKYLHSVQLTLLLANPVKYLLTDRCSNIPLSVRMKSIDTWMHLLKILKHNLPKTELFATAYRPILSLLFQSNDAAILIVAYNVLGFFLGGPVDQSLNASFTSQALSQIADEAEWRRLMIENFPFIVSLFQAAVARDCLGIVTTDAERGALEEAWSACVEALRMHSPCRLFDLMNEVIVKPHRKKCNSVVRILLLETSISTIPSSEMFITDNDSINDSLAGRLTNQYVNMFNQPHKLPEINKALLREWNAIISNLMKFAQRGQTGTRFLKLAISLLELASDQGQLPPHVLHVYIIVARNGCNFIHQKGPATVEDQITPFFNSSMRLLSLALSQYDSDNSDSETVVRDPDRRICHFAIALLDSIRQHHVLPFDCNLLLQFNPVITQLLRSPSPLPEYTSSFLKRCFTMADLSILTETSVANDPTVRIKAVKAFPIPSDLLRRADHRYTQWSELCTQFEKATADIYTSKVPSRLKNEIAKRIEEQHNSFSKLLNDRRRKGNQLF